MDRGGGARPGTPSASEKQASSGAVSSDQALSGAVSSEALAGAMSSAASSGALSPDVAGDYCEDAADANIAVALLCGGVLRKVTSGAASHQAHTHAKTRKHQAHAHAINTGGQRVGNATLQSAACKLSLELFFLAFFNPSKRCVVF